MTKERPDVPPQQTTQTQTPVRNKSIKDYSIMSPNRQSNGIDTDSKEFEGKKFKSRYIDDNGLWTRESVDDGYVEFKDYIEDRRKGVDFGVSFNDKEFKPGGFQSNSESYDENVLDKDDEYEVGKGAISQYKLKDYEDEELFRGQLTAGLSAGDCFSLYNSSKQTNKWVEENIGGQAAYDSAYYKEFAYTNALIRKHLWGEKGDNGNVVDAYRHFMWNAMMTRDKDIGYYDTRNITNRYEYEGLVGKGWLDVNQNPYDYKKDNTKIKCKMDKHTLMDLWNNQVARELANNAVFADIGEHELFKMALDYGWLITDVNKVYEFLGITDFIMGSGDGYVNAEWDLTTNNIIFTKDNMWVELKIGV